MDRKEKAVYLTFDDGPIPGLTEWVLDTLKRYGVKATFFCVGDNIRRNIQIFDRLKKEGHVTANHTMSHIKGFKTKAEDYMQEAEACRKLVGTDLFRPPYGQLKRGQYKALIEKGYKVVLWDVISYDFEQISPEACAANVIDHVKNGSIVLFHDNIKAEANIKYALPLFIEHCIKQGFIFKAL